MPSRKQRRRQAKGRRHEYEYVYLDEEGQEVEGVADDLEQRQNGKAAATKSGAETQGARGIQPPSWNRVGKRALIFAPLMYVTVLLLAGDDVGPAGAALQTLVLLAIFLPFSYFLDTLTYRAAQRRANKARTKG